ncbi:1-acyl-sn-glycerol-3-phosphate acyltransferases [Thermomonospora echinospora]|uniref:1-acyl-sn-glycerol-3-phosphate acyltransferases n=1 Tax=Thermomonospora echinospora TaxID=1992 RepID=A0A1H6DRB6_9ACTN|nr:lysophospholipid acyltransferase family protein [Thermomonospora echinospora]SEG87256.1 1-acyl-sn-glycerol-3-phosphate acyltransferases [Thermomonospora echinospora]
MSHGYSPRWRKFTIAVLRPLLFALLKRDWRGRRNVPAEGGMIVAANHLSWTDPLALAHFVYESGRYPVYLAKSSLFGNRFVGPVLRGTGQIPVYRDRSDARLALKAAEEALRAGECLMFYPEGTCTRDPRLWPMTGQTGVARLAITTGAKVLPVAHWGAHELWPYGTKRFRPFPRKTMHVIAGEPIDLSRYADRPMTAAVLHEATGEIMRAIAGLLGELRGEEPPKELYDHKKAIAERRRRDERGAAAS